MLAQVPSDLTGNVDPFRFVPHPEVWILVAFLTGAYVYMVRVIGPKAVPEGVPPVTTRQKVAFASAMLMMWLASDWPVHDISEDYLYSAHMLQHMMLSYFLPPLALLATPTWLMRVLIGDGKLYRVVSWLSRPVIAGVAFNVVIMVTHIPIIVDASVENGPLHYSLHAAVVVLSLLMWMPVCGPLPELRIGPLAKCIYLFLQSVVPTVPAAWLTFAEGAVYPSYDSEFRLFGWSLAFDQQLAGAVMKTGGGIFLWSIVIAIFFTRFAKDYENEHDYRRRPGSIPDSEIVATRIDDETLTTADVDKAFATSRAPAED
ncbi:MAG: cytochrome c oxidase assembly protein [Actinomycetota bacterium]